MLRKYLRIIALTTLIFVGISFIFQTNALAYQELNMENSGSNFERNLGIGAVIGLTIFGISRYISYRNQRRYEENMELGKSYLEDNDYQAAIEKFSNAKNIDSNPNVNRLLSEATSAYQEKKYELGSDYLDEEDWEMAYRSFRALLVHGDYLDAERKYNQALEELREERLVRIAVLKFDDTATYRYNLGRRSSSLLASELLRKNPKFIELVERDQIETIIDEQKRSETGLIEESTATELGNILGVDYLVVGTVLSGSVSRNRRSEKVTVNEEERTRYTITKEAYSRIEFKLLDTSNGAIVLSDSIRDNYREEKSYYNDDSVMLPSDEEMIDTVLSNILSDFVQRIYDEFEI